MNSGLDKTVSEKYRYENIYREWAEVYKYNLNILQNDLKLLNSKKIKIYTAIDFYDIVEYCFPLSSIMQSGLTQFWSDMDARNIYLKKQISRSILFFVFNKLFSQPVLLLPPYIRETNDFFKLLQKQTGKYVKQQQSKELLTKLTEDFSKEYFAANGDSDLEKLVNVLNHKTFDLIFFFSQNLTSGVDVFRLLLNNHITPDPDAFGKALDHEDIPEIYNSISSRIRRFGNNEFEYFATNVRDDPRKSAQNKRDAEAIRYVIELNKILNEQNIAIFLASSADNMKKINEAYGHESGMNKFTINIQGIDFEALRDINYFYIVMQEIGKFLKRQPDKRDMMDLSFLELSNRVGADLDILDKFLNLGRDSVNISGVLGPMIKNQTLNQAIWLNEEISNMDLSFVIKEFLPSSDISSEISNLINLERSSYKADIINTIRSIQNALKMDEFESKIFKRSIELEFKQLDYFWSLGVGNLPFSEDRKEDITLFNLPFKLFIKDDESNELINGLIEVTKAAKIEVKTYSDISKESSDLILSYLQDLSKRANEIQGDEKYVLWQTVFLSLGRLDLTEIWYDQFYNWVAEDYVKRELSYIYIINFIRSFRKFGSPEENKFREMIDICSLYDIKHHYIGDLDISLEVLCQDQDLLKQILSSRDISLPYNSQITFINEDMMAISETVPAISDIIVLKKIDNALNICQLDMRFVHLKSVIENRYLRDYDGLNRADIERSTDLYENIFLPLVDTLAKEYMISIYADFAYLLALDEMNENYIANLDYALKLMNHIEKYTTHAYWSYTKYYILGYIYFKISLTHPDIGRESADKAYANLNKSLKEIPKMSINLRKIVYSILNILDKDKAD